MRNGADDTDGFETRQLYAWYAVFVLVLANAFAYMDRQILTLLVQPIRKTLDITDFQLSLLHGLAFAIFYTTLGVPFGRLADRHNRTRMIAWAVLSWSVMTSLCGTAKSFAQLFVTRIGVGAGEALLAPAAYSLLSDTFPAKQLPRAFSVYMAGVYIGSGLAAISSGVLIAIMVPVDLPVLGHLEPWQAMFLSLGLPGLLVALLVTTLQEPSRKGLMAGMGHPSYAEVGRFLVAKRGPLGLMALGYSLASMLWNAFATWLPTLFIRIHGWTPTEVGFWFGLALLFCGTGGVVTGGTIASRLRGTGRLDANILIGILSVLAAFPFGLALCLTHNGWLAMALVYPFCFMACMPFGCMGSAVQEITPNQMRGQVSALYILAANIGGLVFGPTLVAFFTDYVFGSDAALPYSLALTMVLVAPVSVTLLCFGAASYRREMERRQVVPAAAGLPATAG
jgi:MFS family permease